MEGIGSTWALQQRQSDSPIQLWLPRPDGRGWILLAMVKSMHTLVPRIALHNMRCTNDTGWQHLGKDSPQRSVIHMVYTFNMKFQPHLSYYWSGCLALTFPIVSFSFQHCSSRVSFHQWSIQWTLIATSPASHSVRRSLADQGFCCSPDSQRSIATIVTIGREYHSLPMRPSNRSVRFLVVARWICRRFGACQRWGHNRLLQDRCPGGAIQIRPRKAACERWIHDRLLGQTVCVGSMC